jgi:membrane protease YdiL (CAAX protease family)
MALVVLVVLAIVSVIVLWRVHRAEPAKLAASIGRMRMLVPSFGGEMAAFLAVCVTAGICEELLYRGWMVNILEAATGSPWMAVAANSIIFGIGHAYQGVKGMLRTVFVGLQLAIL